jgi:hypothetical protein
MWEGRKLPIGLALRRQRNHVDGMRAYLFYSMKKPSVFGFTKDRTGANLPGEHAPWYSLGGRRILSGTAIRGVGSAEALLAAISATGFYIAVALAHR